MSIPDILAIWAIGAFFGFIILCGFISHTWANADRYEAMWPLFTIFWPLGLVVASIKLVYAILYWSYDGTIALLKALIRSLKVAFSKPR